MKKFKTLLISLSALTLFACNGGGGGGSSSGGDTPPSPPTPSTTIQPLVITQLNTLDLSKTAGHKIWYMKVVNPNSTDIILKGFDFDDGSNTPLNPTKYALKYNSAVDGVQGGTTTDCLGLISSMSMGSLDRKTIPANFSCVFKFDAQWDINTSTTTTYPFKMKYQMDDGTSMYIESSVCVAKAAIPDTNIGATVCLPNNQSMSFNINRVSQQADDLLNSNGYAINPTGNKMFKFLSSGVAENYSINYNSSSNSYTPSLITSFNQGIYSTLVYGDSPINYSGDTTFVDTKANANVVSTVGLKWILGLDGEIYGTPITQNTGTNKVYKYDSVNNNVIAVTSIPDGELLKGVSVNGNFNLYSQTNGNICRNKSNYSTSIPLVTNGISFFGAVGNENNNYNGVYRLKGYNTNYYTINNVKYDTSSIPVKYKIDIDTCTVDSANYLTSLDSLNTQFGILFSLSNNTNAYIESISTFSNGSSGS